MGRSSLNGSIPPGSKLAQITKLFMGMNRLPGGIPNELFSLKNTSVTDESGNQIRNCSPLTLVDISKNNLSGKIPRKIPNLKILSSLNLSRNHLTGKIPTNVQTMISVVKLDLSCNNLTVFKDDAFLGNPNLCNQTHSTYTSSSELNSIQAFQQLSSYDIASFRFQTIIIAVISLYILSQALQIKRPTKTTVCYLGVKSHTTPPQPAAKFKCVR
ncbi:hypothetical protein Cgig2_004358 [Carnegiea gigantea]|uniref:Uncharacterized protein n=1 Tax=Carnegiea gigantea TaxID=171969 RepID=A0A9Q1GRK0_9CARY|nr:hypothetical protein Cgig2_004358 [Carnegiea gigantea]